MPKITPSSFKKLTFFKVPAAYWTGVRLTKVDEQSAEAVVKYKWINTNPFKSMYFAVQSMAAELSTGALLAKKTMEGKESFAMLIINHKGSFHKKATGKITFTCNDAKAIDDAVAKAIETNEPQIIITHSKGVDQQGDVVSEYEFQWSIKRRTKKS